MTSLFFGLLMKVMAIYFNNDNERRGIILRMNPGANSEISAVTVIFRLREKGEKSTRPTTHLPSVIIGATPLETKNSRECFCQPML